ncbi:MAG TPA: hypothetical protein VE981_12060 [Planctomycetota bacterium]|nr:hypothetical protein [Planctomycetota bacterium]
MSLLATSWPAQQLVHRSAWAISAGNASLEQGNGTTLRIPGTPPRKLPTWHSFMAVAVTAGMYLQRPGAGR